MKEIIIFEGFLNVTKLESFKELSTIQKSFYTRLAFFCGGSPKYSKQILKVVRQKKNIYLDRRR